MFTKIKWILLLGILIGPFLAFMGYKEKQTLAALQAEGKTVDGVVAGGETSGRRRSRSYKVDVTYTPEGGAAKTTNFKVKRAFYDEIAEKGIGAPVKVTYSTKDPTKAIIVGGSDDDTAMLPAGLAWAGLGLVTGIGILFMGKKGGAA